MTISRLYKSSDASAPLWATSAGGMIAVLDAVLVNGYGSQAAAGWTKEFSGTNKAVYRSGATGNRFYLRLDDATAGTSKFRGYESMSDVDTGVDAFPTVAELADGLKMNANGSGAGWAIAANDRAFYIFGYAATSADSVGPGVVLSTAATPQVFGFGRFESLVAGDPYNHFMMGGDAPGGTNGFIADTTNLALTTPSGGFVGHTRLARKYDGVTKSVVFYKHYLGAPLSIGRSGPLVPDTVSGGLLVQDKVSILEDAGGLGVIRRGYLPGIMFPIGQLHSPSKAFYTFGGAGALAGRQFTVVPFVNSGVNQYTVFEFGVEWGN